MSSFKVSEKGIRLITKCESLHDGDLTMVGLQPKMDPVGIWTEGYGRAMEYEGSFLKGEENEELAYKLSTIKTEEDAMKALLEDLEYYEERINRLDICETQEQFDALCSFSYNVGVGNLLSSTLCTRVRKKDTPERIKEAFLMWNKGTVKGKKVPLKGLTLRRGYEADLFNTGDFQIAA